MVLVLPPLRERRDIAGILDALMTSCGARERGIRLTSPARETLLHHGWPGNLREMANLLRTLIALAEDEERIDVNSLPPDMPLMGQPAQKGKLADLEDELLRRAIAEHNGNISAAARQLGLHRSTLYRRLAEFSSQN
jgi:transcriptional regulator of acetoin/glycerol metabolism